MTIIRNRIGFTHEETNPFSPLTNNTSKQWGNNELTFTILSKTTDSLIIFFRDN